MEMSRQGAAGGPGGPVPDRTRTLKACMRPNTPCSEWMPTSPSHLRSGPEGGACDDDVYYYLR